MFIVVNGYRHSLYNDPKIQIIHIVGMGLSIDGGSIESGQCYFLQAGIIKRFSLRTPLMAILRYTRAPNDYFNN